MNERTVSGPCPYFSQKKADTLTGMLSQMDKERVEKLLFQGYRHFDRFFFKPQCTHCTSCIPYRICLSGFSFSRWQRRILNKRPKISFHTPDLQKAYELYVLHKTKFSTICDEPIEDFITTFFSPSEISSAISIYSQEKELIAVCHYDNLADSYSAIYTYYDYVNYPKLSLGSSAVLTLIEMALLHGKSHVYLGYLIEDHAHMGYKSRFLPGQILDSNGKWIDFKKNATFTV